MGMLCVLTGSIVNVLLTICCSCGNFTFSFSSFFPLEDREDLCKTDPVDACGCIFRQSRIVWHLNLHNTTFDTLHLHEYTTLKLVATTF